MFGIDGILPPLMSVLALFLQVLFPRTISPKGDLKESYLPAMPGN
jgi:hypothetical protein